MQKDLKGTKSCVCATQLPAGQHSLTGLEKCMWLADWALFGGARLSKNVSRACPMAANKLAARRSLIAISGTPAGSGGSLHMETKAYQRIM